MSGETPRIIQITPSLNDNSDLTITGIARDPITGEDEPVTIKNLKKSIPVIVDGETCTVTQQGANKYPETDFWEFPSLLPGENQITLSNAVNTVTIKYRPRYALEVENVKSNKIHPKSQPIGDFNGTLRDST
ncbi:MAG: phage distal tail protein [Lacrimispora saccharolytica]